MVKYNTAYLVQANSIDTYYKKLLPDYDVFFDKRYFQAGDKNLCFTTANNTTAAVTICEDFWDKNYDIHPVMDIKNNNENVDLMINLSSSPFVI